MSTVIGIDLGTSNSVIATLEHGRPRALSVDGSPIVPSVVLYQEDGTIVTGRQARNLALQFPERAVSSVKRGMGRVETIEVGGRSVAPEDVSAEILRALKTAAEAELGHDVDQAVITVPAYFDDAQRKATLAAGERAGLTVLRLLNEPTAAALAYERPPPESTTPEIMLVYDLGGGTFDVSVIEVMGTIREVRSSTGNSALGGDDFDEKLVQRFTEFLRTRHQTDVNSEAVTMARLRRAAQEAKVQLSTQVEVEVRQEFLSGADATPLHLELSITRREFEASIMEMLNSTVELSQRALDEANLTADETLTRICLVGGSTRIPLVRHLLADSFGVEIHEEVDPDLAVGLGAAMQAALLQGQSVQRVLVDVTAHTLGIRTLDEVDGYGYAEADTFSPIVHRNTALPVERTEEFHTAVHHQEQVEIEVLQGESARACRNDRVGSFRFPLRPVPQGSPVWVQFAYDLNGIVRVTASQPGGADMTVQLEVSGSSEKGSETTTELGTSTPARGSSTIVRRAEALLEELSPGDRSVLTHALEAYATADSDEACSQAEDALLDLFLEHESH